MMKKKAIYIVSVIFLLICWQLISIGIDKEALFPSIPVLISSLINLLSSSSFWISLSITIVRGITGIIISFLAAILFSILFARHSLIYELFRPVLSIMRSVPVISFILLALLFLNPESIPVLIGFLTMFPILTENLTQGIINQDRGLLQMGKLFRLSRYNYVMQIIYPQLKPFLYSGLATAIGFGWRAIIMGEVLSQCTFGIGSEMKKAQLFVAVPELLAWTAVAVIVSFIADRLVSRLSEYTPAINYTALPVQKSVPTLTSPIEIQDVTFAYGDNIVLDNVSFRIESQQITGISAPSGKGKTTILYLLSGLQPPPKGKIKIQNHTSVSFVFQEPRLLSHLSLTDNISLPLAAYMSRKEAKEKAISLLKEMQMEEKAESLPDELSYGQQQRAAIARAVAYPAPLLLMDEPFKGLDYTLTTGIIRFLRQHQIITAQTIIFTSHQPGELEQLAGQVIKL